MIDPVLHDIDADVTLSGARTALKGRTGAEARRYVESRIDGLRQRELALAAESGQRAAAAKAAPRAASVSSPGQPRRHAPPSTESALVSIGRSRRGVGSSHWSIGALSST